MQRCASISSEANAACLYAPVRARRSIETVPLQCMMMSQRVGAASASDALHARTRALGNQAGSMSTSRRLRVAKRDCAVATGCRIRRRVQYPLTINTRTVALLRCRGATRH